jgi:hypothetical protein
VLPMLLVAERFECKFPFAAHSSSAPLNISFKPSCIDHWNVLLSLTQPRYESTLSFL